MNRILLIQTVAKSIATSTGISMKEAIDSIKSEPIDNLKFFATNL